MSVPMVSVVMSVYDQVEFVGEAIESILNQSFEDFELIVVNDGSTDGSTEVIGRCASADARLRVFEQQNRGLVYSLNAGCAMARGKYIARLDADDVAISSRFEQQVEFLERHPEVGVLGGGMYLLGREGSIRGKMLFPQDHQSIMDWLSRAQCIVHPTVMMRTEVFRSVGGYRRALSKAEDYDLWFRIAEHSQLANLPHPIIYYRVHPGQATFAKMEEEVAAEMAVRLAARRRACGDPDPLDHFEQVTPEILPSLGITPQQYADALAVGYSHAAQYYVAAGYAEHARKILDSAALSCNSRPPSRGAMAELHWQSARLHLSDQEIAAGLACLIRACLSKPSLAARPFDSLFHRAASFRFVRNLRAGLGFNPKA